jgi:glycosyltransferase involved in cell wall biosynthesis
MEQKRKKILMACNNDWNSPFQVGSHHLAKGFLNAGYDVAFLSEPVSPFHFLAGDGDILKKRFNNYFAGGEYYYNNHLWAYVPGALLTPHNKPLLRLQLVSHFWNRMTLPNINHMLKKNNFDDVDIIYFDSINFNFLLKCIKYNKSILRISDNLSSFKKYTEAMRLAELKLAQSVDLVIYSASNLKKYIADLGAKKSIFFANGVDFKHFINGSRKLPEEYKSITKPIVIYIGAMDVWFDFDLINYLAEKLSSVSFVLIGPVELARKKLNKLPNIYLLGSKKYQEIPKYLYNADVGIIPFNIKEYAKLINYINPLKLYEYMACGLPVVSVTWEELAILKSPALLCNNYEDFSKGVESSLSENINKKILIDFASNYDWGSKINTLLNYIANS